VEISFPRASIFAFGKGRKHRSRPIEMIAQAASQKTGLDRLREINLGVNDLLGKTRFFSDPDLNRWQSVDEVLNSEDRSNCKDYVVLKEELLRRSGIESRRILVWDKSQNSLHVVLQVQYIDQALILDNMRGVMVTLKELINDGVYDLYMGAP
jgi:predicted transglutaminase-like cysteine proteinase